VKWWPIAFAGLLAGEARADLIDVHAHVGSFRGFDMSLATLLANLDEGGVRIALVSNIDGAALPGTTADLDEERANRRVAEVVRAHPDRLRGLLWARPLDGDPARLARFLDDPATARLFVGIKLHPEFNGFAADDARVDRYLALCERYHLPAVVHSGRPGSPSSPERIYALARRHPTVPVVLYHMGFGGAHEQAIAAVEKSLARRDARLYLETAQADPEMVLQAIARVGADRVLFGTDASYFGKGHYRTYEPLLMLLRARLSDEDYAKVTFANAERLFGLPRRAAP